MRGQYYDETKPQAIKSPETPAHADDLRAIVAYVAHQCLKSELDWYSNDAEFHDLYPSLKGITRGQIEQAITEVLS